MAYEEYKFFISNHYDDSVKINSISTSDLLSKYYLGTVLIRQGKELMGLCSIFYNKELNSNDKKNLCFGYFECVDDLLVAQNLTEAIEKKALELNCFTLLGPLNGSTWNNYRFSRSETKAPFFTERYNHPYYVEQFKALGYSEIAHYESQIDHNLQLLPARKKEQVVEFWKNRNLSIRNIDSSDFTNEFAKIHRFCLDAFQRNLFYTPISEADFLDKYKPIERFIDPDFVLIAEEKEEIIGLIFAIPDLYSSEEKRLIVKTIAKKSGTQYAGISHLLGEELVTRAKAKNYTALIHAFMHINNASKQISRQFSGQTFRQYVLFSKHLGHG